MKVLEQTMHKGFEISHWWQERIFNLKTNHLDYCIVGVYQDDPKAVVLLGSYGSEDELSVVFDKFRFAWRNKSEDTFIMPDRE